jgi:carboxymethylenebutenolidase
VAAILASVPPERFVADMQAGVTELQRRLPGKELAATGFCFGGGMVWLLLTSGERRLAAAIPFYGPFPEGGDLEGLQGRGARDLRRARRSRQRNARRCSGSARGGAPEAQARDVRGRRHAFFNDTGDRFNPAAAAEAYRCLIGWLGRFVDERNAGPRRHGDGDDD